MQSEVGNTTVLITLGGNQEITTTETSIHDLILGPSGSQPGDPGYTQSTTNAWYTDSATLTAGQFTQPLAKPHINTPTGLPQAISALARHQPTADPDFPDPEKLAEPGTEITETCVNPWGDDVQYVWADIPEVGSLRESTQERPWWNDHWTDWLSPLMYDTPARGLLNDLVGYNPNQTFPPRIVPLVRPDMDQFIPDHIKRAGDNGTMWNQTYGEAGHEAAKLTEELGAQVATEVVASTIPFAKGAADDLLDLGSPNSAHNQVIPTRIAPSSGTSQLAEQIAGPGQRLAGQIDTIARMRSFADRLKDVTANPSKWKVVRSVSEASTNIRNRGGRSLQEILRNEATGETIVRHTLFRADGSIFELPHFRDLWK